MKTTIRTVCGGTARLLVLSLVLAACQNDEGPLAPEGPEGSDVPMVATPPEGAALNFSAPQQWSSFFCRKGEVCKVADVNGDARADLVAFRHRLLGNRNGVYVALSNGSGFGASQEWTTRFCHSTETCEVGDVNATGPADILAFTRDPSNDVFIGLSTQLAFAPPALWSSFFCRTGEVCLVADVSGDRRHDVIAFNHGLDGANAVYVGLSTGTGFGAPTKAHDFFCTKSQTCAVGDVTGDRKADVIAFTRGANPRVFVGISQ